MFFQTVKNISGVSKALHLGIYTLNAMLFTCNFQSITLWDLHFDCKAFSMQLVLVDVFSVTVLEDNVLLIVEQAVCFS